MRNLLATLMQTNSAFERKIKKMNDGYIITFQESDNASG